MAHFLRSNYYSWATSKSYYLVFSRRSTFFIPDVSVENWSVGVYEVVMVFKSGKKNILDSFKLRCYCYLIGDSVTT